MATKQSALTSKRGYWGVAIWQPKTDANFGSLMRSAHAFGANFIVLIGARYHKEPTDTSKASRHIPIFQVADWDEFQTIRPFDCEIVRCEVDGDTNLPEFKHKPRTLYLFGGEDRTLPKEVGDRSVRIDTDYCLNVAVAGAVVMYDRSAKGVAA